MTTLEILIDEYISDTSKNTKKFLKKVHGAFKGGMLNEDIILATKALSSLNNKCTPIFISGKEEILTYKEPTNYMVVNLNHRCSKDDEEMISVWNQNFDELWQKRTTIFEWTTSKTYAYNALVLGLGEEREGKSGKISLCSKKRLIEIQSQNNIILTDLLPYSSSETEINNKAVPSMYKKIIKQFIINYQPKIVAFVGKACRQFLHEFLIDEGVILKTVKLDTSSNIRTFDYALVSRPIKRIFIGINLIGGRNREWNDSVDKIKLYKEIGKLVRSL